MMEVKDLSTLLFSTFYPAKNISKHHALEMRRDNMVDIEKLKRMTA
jgi:hypothetical protein